MTFTYVDPIYVWIQQANQLLKKGHELIWSPKRHRHPDTGQPAYGAGIEYGLLFHKAKASIPAAGEVALINLSWDGGGTGVAQRSACPICVQVMNVNTSPVYSVGLVGYLPHLEVIYYYIYFYKIIFVTVLYYIYFYKIIFVTILYYIYFYKIIFVYHFVLYILLQNYICLPHLVSGGRCCQGNRRVQGCRMVHNATVYWQGVDVYRASGGTWV